MRRRRGTSRVRRRRGTMRGPSAEGAGCGDSCSAPRICLEGACQRPKFSKGRLRRAFGQWGPSARLAISCATLAARTRPWKTHPPREWWSGMSSCLSSCLHSCSVPYQSRQLTYPLVTRIRTRRGLLAGGKVQSGAERSRAEPDAPRSNSLSHWWATPPPAPTGGYVHKGVLAGGARGRSPLGRK